MSEVDYADEQERKELKKAYEKSVEAYVKAFMKKHDMLCHEWIANDVGTVILCSDFYVSFRDLKIDIDMDAPKGMYFDYYYESVDEAAINKPFMNYSNYIKLNK